MSSSLPSLPCGDGKGAEHYWPAAETIIGRTVLAHVLARCYVLSPKGSIMTQAARRHQPPITIRSARATALLRRLATSGRSQADIIEEALERMAAQRKTLADALMPNVPHDFDWEPARSQLVSPVPDLGD
jgi:ribose 1,5-bisphosphokinase PhnN